MSYSQKLEYNLKRNMNSFLFVLSLLVFSASALSCEQGQVANPLNICIQPRYIEGCHQYLSETSCKICDFRYSLQPNGLCDVDLESTEDCCASRAGDGTCSKCKAGLYLIDGKCQESNIVGCLQKDSFGTCLNCASGYYLKAGTCSKTIKDCVEFVDRSRTVCANCKQGFSLYNNFCVENSIIGCKNEVDHVCQQCYPLFTLNNGHCTIPHCKAYNDYGCAACECGNYLTAEGNCKSMELGCVRYQRGQCTDCFINFTLKGSQCSIEGCVKMDGIRCSKCSEDYDQINYGCALKNCMSWKEGKCVTCKEGYSRTIQGCRKNKSLITE